MKLKTRFIFCLCLSFTLQLGHAASVNSAQSKSITPISKSSLIEKALNDKKLKNATSCNHIPSIVKSHNSTPAQSFFSNQNQHFSKLLQAILPQNGVQL